MTYESCIDYLYSRLPMFSRVGAIAYKKDLDNIRSLLAALDNPQEKYKCIHIAGTNGKGSVSHMLAAVLSTASYKTGLYTSPHLRDFRERIRIDGQMVTKEFVVSFTERIQPLIETISPSFFEVTVAMAFEWFAEQKIDVAVIETGLGGRLDSTNIILPELSIITNIGFDHAAILGDTLEKIAYEKAGIIKPDIPVVIGETLPETLPVFLQKAKEQKAEIILAEGQYDITAVVLGIESLSVTLSNKHHDEVVIIKTDLPGAYQQFNLRTAYTALKKMQFSGWQITQDDIRNGLKNVGNCTGFQGRWQVLNKHPWVVADVAHNAEGILQLVNHIKEIAESVGNIHVVYGTSSDKDIESILSLLPTYWHYYFTKAQLPRAMDEVALQVQAQKFGLVGDTFKNVMDSLQIIAEQVAPNDLVVVCGSVFLVGEIDEVNLSNLFPLNA